jgi:hypothetical protein
MGAAFTLLFAGLVAFRSAYEHADAECGYLVERFPSVQEYGVDWRWDPPGYVCQYARDGRSIEHEFGVIP